MPTDRFIRDKAAIRAELERRARARQVITYGGAAALVGRAKQGLGPLLTAIGTEEKQQDRPDLGVLVVRMRTGLPSYVGAGQDAQDRAIAVQEAVFAVWAGQT
ncbi:hypothetical protein [Lichenibacterium dinghuense]|uniref:hypothetical protein n=1 Tax=Lichenibacterium dinghuense TaxID=2895977 RepID=UPI001F446593|nr:hypothetical protein [Lichenibacterium sp. 6Y81]